MGNTALITGSHVAEHGGLAIYLHWNGDYEPVWAFCKYCQLRGFRSPDVDEPYAIARLAQVIGNFFGGTLSVGVVYIPEGELEDYAKENSNGAWIVNNKWEIIDNASNYVDLGKVKFSKVDAYSRLLELDRHQPSGDRLGVARLQAAME